LNRLNSLPTERGSGHVERIAAELSTRPHQLSVERLATPLGVDDAVPLFGWRLPSRNGGERQAAYRIRVLACPGPVDGDPVGATEVAWDSGEVSSARSVDVAYGGPALAPRTRYRWAVGVRFVGSPAAGPVWSEPATFETGLLGVPIAGRWIGAAEVTGAVDLDRVSPERDISRIWLPGSGAAGAATFRRTFHLPGGRPLLWARLRTGGSVASEAVVNGVVVRERDDLVAVLRPGENEIVVRCVAARPGHGGLLLRLDIAATAHPVLSLGSDDTWQVRGDDDTDWCLAEAIGVNGRAPHGRDEATLRPSSYLCGEVALGKPVARARLRATALGVYEVSVNGRRVGADRLAPGWVDFARRVPYQTWDVTDLLGAGGNTVAAVLADGWALGNLCWFGSQHYARRRAFVAELDVLYRDGTRQLFGTHDGWRLGEGEIRYADLQNGQVVDARVGLPGWDRPHRGSEPVVQTWPNAVEVPVRHRTFEAQVAPPIEVRQTVAPVTVTAKEAGRFVVDFGQNLVGWIRLRLRAPAGHRVMVGFAEMLDSGGELYLAGLRGARASDEYVAAGAADGEVFEPTFTVHGFRYCEISGYPGILDPEAIMARVVYAAMPAIGWFSCSDERLNRLQRNIVWSQRGNFLTVPTDCPQRDERLGWTGDVQAFAATATFNYDVRNFLRKWLRDVRDAIGPDGGVPHVAPDVLSPQMGSPQVGAAGWGDAIVIVPMALLNSYGDTRSIEENLSAIAGWLNYLERHSDGLIRPAEGFGDWLAIDATPTDLVATAFFAHTARLAGELAATVSDARAEQWHALHARVRLAFRERFVRGGGRLSVDTQTGYVLALHFGLLDPHERERATASLVAAIAARNWHLSTGFLGTPYLLHVLSDNGRLDVAYRLLTTTTFPSWLYPILAGDATTIWERWDSWTESRGFQDPAMTSFNHYAYGAVGDWLYRVVGGLSAVEPGYRRARIAPRPGGGITSARTSLETPYGTLSCDWRLEHGDVVIDVEVPPNTTAEIVAPDGRGFDGAGRVEVHAGQHRVIARTAIDR
jgi:alpha-L-rhamnosidase